MIPSVYIVGGAGSGKSTFMEELLQHLDYGHGPLTDLHERRNAKALVALRGHQLHPPAGGKPGIYLGKMRDSHPGTDGLDRASHQVGIEWLERDMHEQYRFVLAEGFVLATKGFLAALHDHTNMLLVSLWVDGRERDRRFEERGTNQSANFVKSTATAAFNRTREHEDRAGRVLRVDTEDVDAWEIAQDIVVRHLFRN